MEALVIASTKECIYFMYRRKRLLTRVTTKSQEARVFHLRSSSQPFFHAARSQAPNSPSVIAAVFCRILAFVVDDSH